MLELGMPLDYIVFCDTGAEFDVMYEYIKKLNEYIWKKYKKCVVVLDNPIGQFKLRTYEDVTKRLKTTRARADIVGRPCGITSIVTMDACTRDLKVNRIKHFIKHILKIDEKSVIHYNGYTYKEVLKNRGGSQERMKENYRYPLYEWKWNEEQISAYLKEKSIFNPLYNHFTRTGCFLCPKQSPASWYQLWKHYPLEWERAKKIEKWCIDNNAVQQFFIWDFKKNIGITLSEKEEEYRIMNKQQEFDLSDEAIETSCFCK
jgi:3'-phosphoadenosine 5'-phosphosulfate sulfotransferase (PAPS reductase)/FAD synthetase